MPSLSRGKYFMTLIDYYSRNVRLYILKTKDQAQSLENIVRKPKWKEGKGLKN